jgi:hypothetical protein
MLSGAVESITTGWPAARPIRALLGATDAPNIWARNACTKDE